MARGVFSTSNYLLYGDGIITATPLTMACWIYPTSNAAVNGILGLESTNASPDGFWMYINTDASVHAATYSAGATSTANSSGGVTLNAWNHIGAVIGSSTSRIAYRDGAAGTEVTTSRTPATAITKTTIGTLRYGASTIYRPAVTNNIAEVGFWNVALTAADMLQLAAGYSPLFVKPESLFAYYPLIRGDASGDEPDLMGGLKMVEQGTVAVQPHPRVFYPGKPWRLGKAPTAGISDSVILSGIGINDSSALKSINVLSTLIGTGDLNTSAINNALAYLILKENGDLSLSATNNILASTILSENGTLTLDGITNIISSGILGGNGDLLVSSLVLVQSLVNLLNNGDIISTPFLTIPANTILNGLGYLIATSLIEGLVTGNVILSGRGDLIITALNLILGQPILSGQGNLTSSALNSTFGQTSLSGQGILLLEALLVILAQSILSGQVTNQADAKILIDSLTNLTGRLDLLPVGLNINLSSTVLSGEITNLASALLVISTLIALVGSGKLDVSSTLIIPSTTILSGIGSLLATSTAEGLVEALAILSGQGNLTLNALNTINAQLSVYGRGDLNTLPQLNISAFTSLLGVAFLIATGEINVIVPIVTGDAILAGRGDLILSALNLVNGEVLTTGQAVLSTQALVNVLSNAILTGQGNTQAYATLLISAIGALYAAGAIIPIGTIPSGIITITPLSRTFIVTGENRIYIVDSEGRIFVINSEDRSFSISD